ncbi:MAG: hypothetical protein L7U72_15020, partial [Rubripirellula sp.]|nr:hypothetical protein [Rubripirellula sp.]
WLVRGGILERTEGVMRIVPQGKNNPALIRNGFQLSGPVNVTMTIKSSSDKPIRLNWRNQNEKTFMPENQISIPIEESSQWQTLSVEIPNVNDVVHVRFNLPAVSIQFKSLELSPSKGKSIRLPQE